MPEHARSWPGPVYGLDLTGHGRSTRPVGGGYTAEILMGDVDAALVHLGSATILGRGLGAYVALLAAGGRPELVRGAVLTDGPGLVGGGIRPTSTYIEQQPAPSLGGGAHEADDADRSASTPDPFALAELSRDVRPPDYALEYVRQSMQWSGLDTPIAVCAVVRPEWLAAVADEPGVLVTGVAEALARFAP